MCGWLDAGTVLDSEALCLNDEPSSLLPLIIGKSGLSIITPRLFSLQTIVANQPRAAPLQIKGSSDDPFRAAASVPRDLPGSNAANLPKKGGAALRVWRQGAQGGVIYEAGAYARWCFIPLAAPRSLALFEPSGHLRPPEPNDHTAILFSNHCKIEDPALRLPRFSRPRKNTPRIAFAIEAQLIQT